MIVVDIETIPDQSKGAIERIGQDLVVKSPDLTKPKLIELVTGGDKFKSVAELKEMWVEEHGAKAKMEQAITKWLKTSFNGGYGQICCICVDDNGKERIYTDESGEAAMLADFWNDLRVMEPYFIAHNAKFDIPFLYHRSVINQIQPPKFFKSHGRHDRDHFCTMEAWAGFNGKISLNNLAKILGLGQKMNDMDGSQVWPEYQKGNFKKIAEYCLQDVRLTKQVYNKLTFK